MDEVCEALDHLYIENLELMESKILHTINLENLVCQGQLELAKSRYIRGKESVGMLQIPNENNEFKSCFELETTYSEEDKEIPIFDCSLRNEVNDPIKWFGVLVPQSLKNAQKKFKDSTYLAVELANISAQLEKLKRKEEILKECKRKARNNYNE